MTNECRVKQCNHCMETKPLDCFHASKGNVGGVRKQCKECRANHSKQEHANGTAIARRLAREARLKEDEVAARREKKRKWKEQNKDKVEASRLKNLHKHVEKNKTRQKEYKKTNAEKIKEAARMRRLRNPSHSRAYVSARRARVKAATPHWANLGAIRNFYLTADSLGMLVGEWFHVDHIVPLKSPIVCGLHCEANLRVISAVENRKKNNRYWPDMP